MERPRSPRIRDGRHQLEVTRDRDMNPARAKPVTSPSHWKWSSFRHHAFGEEDDLVTDARGDRAQGGTGRTQRGPGAPR